MSPVRGEFSLERAVSLVVETLSDLAARNGGSVSGGKLAAEAGRRFGQPIHHAFGLPKFNDFVRLHCPNIDYERVPGKELAYFLVDAPPRPSATEIHAASPNAENTATLPSPWYEWLLSILARRGTTRYSLRDEADVRRAIQNSQNLSPHDVRVCASICLQTLSSNKTADTDLLLPLLRQVVREADSKHGTSTIHVAVIIDWLQPQKDVTSETLRSALKTLSTGAPETPAVDALSPAFIRSLALICARSVSLNPDLPETILGGRAPLYFRVREAARGLLEAGAGTADHQVFSALSDQFLLRNRVASEIAASADNGGITGIRPALARLMQEMGRSKVFFFGEEPVIWDDSVSLFAGVNRSLAVLNDTLPETIAQLAIELHGLLSRVRSTEARARECSPLLHTTSFVAISRIRPLLDALVQDLSVRVRPRVQLEHAKRRYPLNRMGGAIAIPFEINNAGGGIAREIQALFWTEAPGVTLTPTKFQIASLAPGHSWSSSLEAECQRTLRHLKIHASFTFVDPFDGSQRTYDELRIENDSHDAETNWSRLLEQRPYALNPIDRKGTLWGRQAQIVELLSNLRTGTSTILWGQKRVGKTSVARVLFRHLENNNDVVPMYLRKGDLAGYDEGEIGREIAERLISYCARHKLVTSNPQIPTAPDFGGRLTRLTRVLDDLQDYGFQRQVLLILDEFDELPVEMYTGDRGDFFFGTLRALTERNVSLILVGSERIPAIIQQYSQLLNKYNILRLDALRSRDDIYQIISEPVREVIEYDAEAKDRIATLSDGNPYYINLLCLRILHAMVDSRRTYVDVADVQSAAAALCAEPSPSHWSHFWEDSASVSQRERTSYRQSFAEVLRLFATRPLDRGFHPSELEARLDKSATFAAPFYALLDLLVRRGVLNVEGQASALRYNVRPKIFRWWLCEGGGLVMHGATVDQISTEPSMESPPSVIDEFPLTDEEVLAISEGLFYRGRLVDGMQIRLWLKQFGPREEVLIAYRVLRALRDRYYFDASAVSLLLEAALENANAHLQRQMANLELPLPPANVELREALFVAFLGDPLKSGAELARMAKKLVRARGAGTLAEGLAWCQRGDGPRVVLIVDDFVGSGAQATRELRRGIRAFTSAGTPSTILDPKYLLFVPLVANADGLDEVGRLVPEVACVPVKTLDESDKAFSSQSGIFEDDDLRKRAKELFWSVGDALNADHPLGWEGLEALVLFPHTIPNASLPALWRSGEFRGRPWKALFSR